MLEEKIKPNPGDVVVIMPKNSKMKIEELCILLNIKEQEMDKEIKLELVDKNDEKCEYLLNKKGHRIKDLLKNYFDFMSVPKQNVFLTLHLISKNENEKERLYEIATDIDDYLEYCYRPKKTFIDVCIDFYNTAKEIKFENLFDLIPAIYSRSYSIALFEKKQFSIIVAKVEFKTVMKTPRIGLCSNYLCEEIKIGKKVNVLIKKGILK